MKPKIVRAIYFVALIISSLCISFFSIKSTALLTRDALAYKDLVASCLYLFNIPVLLSWFVLGAFAGMIVFFLAVSTTLLIAIGSQMNHFYLYIVLLFSSCVFGLAYVYRFRRLKSILYLELEKLEEDKNILHEEFVKHKALADSYDSKLKDLTKLKTITEFLSLSLKPEDTANTIIKSTYDLINGADRCLLYLMDTRKEELHLVASQKKPGVSKITSKKGDIFDNWVFKQRHSLLVTDAYNDFRFVLEKDKDGEKIFHSLILSPLMSEGKVLGILRVDSARKNAFSTYELGLLDKVAGLSAISVHNSILYQIQEELAIKDGLTGLYMPRYFKERLKDEFQRSLRKHLYLSLLMIDIDDFKKYNDMFGHSAGDVLLKRMSRIFLSSVDGGDIVSRYGGEEFAILLFDTGKQEAVNIAGVIKEKIEGEEFSLRRQTTRVTVSIGVSTCPPDAEFEEELIQKADEALLRAKRQGKNKVCQSK